ncbi:hypothetical protein GGH99_004820, partial [Coemansia sp. RSA 1285]
RSPYVVVLPRNTRWMQKTHGRMLARVDPAAASKFFDHMATTDTRYAYFKADAQKKKRKKRKKEQNSTGADDGKDAFSDIAALRKAVKDLGHLRTNSVREMRARIDGWMARPTSDGLAKASQLLLGTRFIVDRAARTRSTLVGKFVIRMSLSVARQEAERGLAELLGSQKPALSPAGFENIVKSRQLLLLLLRIKTMCTRHAAGGDGGDPSNGGAGAGAGAVRYADRMRPVVALLDVLRQTLVERMDTAKGLASRTGGIRASITALHELVVAERNHLAGNPTGGAAGLFSSSSFRSKYRGMFMAEIKKLYSRLKDVTLSGPDTHVLNTPDTDTVNMAATNISHYHQQQQQQHLPPALVPAQSAQLQPVSLQLQHPQVRKLSSPSAPSLLPYTPVASRPPEIPRPPPFHSSVSSILPSPPSAVPAVVAGLPQGAAAVMQEADVAATRLDLVQPQPQPQQQFLMGANAAGAGYSIVSREQSSEISNAGEYRSGPVVRSAGSSPTSDLVRGGATQSAVVGNAQQLGLSQMSFPNHQQHQQQQQQQQAAMLLQRRSSTGSGSNTQQQQQIVSQLNQHHHRVTTAGPVQLQTYSQMQTQQLPSPVHPSSSSTSLVPSTAAITMMMNPHTPTLQTTMMTPFSSTSRISSTAGFVENGNNNASGKYNSENDGGGGEGPSSSSWDLACALCGNPLHLPSGCGNRTNISALTRRRVEVEMDKSLAPGLKEMTLDTIDKYLKAAFQAP